MPARIASRAPRGDRPAPGGSERAGTLKEEFRMQPIDSATLANKDYVAEQYRRYKADPRSVGEEWALFFAGFELGASGNGAAVGAPAAVATGAPVIGVFDLVHSYRELGHLVADLNPLAAKPVGHPLLEPSEFGFGEEELDRVVSCGGFRGCSRASIRDLIARLQATYCGRLGVEYMHIQDQEQRVWLQERMETTSNRPDLSPEERLRVLDSLITAEGLEQFLQLRYPTAKRFSLEGSVRAKQQHLHDAEYARVVPVLMHGDAAFTGQGVVAETLWLSELDGYRTGGTVHIIINNQIGFTTPPEAYRFTPYPSDVAKIIQAPVFQVNGDDPEAAVQAARLAIGFRQRFKKDVFIDLVCYRRHGHNELDDPTFTQPVMYKKIAAKPTPLTLYREQLVQAGAVAAEEAERRAREFRELLDDAQSYARDFMPRQPVFVFGGLWQGFGWAGDDWSARTAVAPEVLHEIAAAFTRLPEGFTPHPRVARLMEARAQMVREGRAIDWSCAEALAIGALLLEGIPVRMSGQDTCRGTFSQRHAVLHDVETGDRYVPLDNIRGDQVSFRVIDSMLSEK